MGALDVEVGQRVHRLLARYAAAGERPSVERVFADAGALVRAWPFDRTFNPGPQRVTCLTVIGITLLPPPTWRFLGAEVELGGGFADLVWESADGCAGIPAGQVVGDEVKVAGHSGQLEDNRTMTQIRRQLVGGPERYGHRFAGTRLLGLSGPLRSLFYAAGEPLSERRRLVDTPWWFAPRPSAAEVG